MADKAVVTQTTLDAIGQAIIDKGGATEAMTPAQMPAAIASIPTGDIWWTGWKNDGNTHLWIDTTNAPYFATQQINISFAGDGANDATVEIDWGDGDGYDAPISIRKDRSALSHHTYAKVGRYVITIKVSGATVWMSRSPKESVTNFMNEYTNDYVQRSSMFVYAEIGEDVNFGNPMFRNFYGLKRLKVHGFVKNNANITLSCHSLVEYVIRNDEVMTPYMKGLYSLTEFVIPASIRTLNVMADNSIRNDISVPEGVIDIPNEWFLNNYTAVSVTLPSTVKTIGSKVFEYGILRYLRVNAVTPPVLANSNSLLWNNAANTYIYVPDGSVDAYKTADNWSSKATMIKPISEIPA